MEPRITTPLDASARSQDPRPVSGPGDLFGHDDYSDVGPASFAGDGDEETLDGFGELGEDVLDPDELTFDEFERELAASFDSFDSFDSFIWA